MGESLRDARRGAGAAEGARPADSLGRRAADLLPRALSAQTDFLAAVDAYPFVDVALDPRAVTRAREALERSGLLLVGEPHGVAETPSVLYALMRTTGATGLALEWTREEVGAPLERFLATSELDLAPLWSPGGGTDFLAGDGRVTAGHFAVLRRLRDEGRLDQLVLFDAPDGGGGAWAARDRRMAERLLAGWRHSSRLVAVAGAFHAQRYAPDGDPLAAQLARAVPGLGVATIEYSGGSCWFHGVRPLEPAPFRAEITIEAGEAHPATVPRA